MTLTNLIFSSDNVFKVISVDNQVDLINIYVQSRQKCCLCPNCCEPSTKIHSYYIRKFKDLPTFGKACRIFLKSRKYYCPTAECPLKIFTERYEDHFKPSKRTTNRLEEKLLNTVLELGGRPAERICRNFSVPVSDTTLLRLINRVPLPDLGVLTAVGIDDWAFKKRKRYGSILVDLTTRRVVDLLPDREEKSLTAWLRKQPEIEIITRDRYGKYQRAATKGASQAIQVTDRWHLLKNLGEAFTKMMTREYGRLTRSLVPQSDGNLIEIPQVLPVKEPQIATTGILKQRYDEMKKLQAKGLSIKGIARQLGMHRNTVRKYMLTDTLVRKSYKDSSMIENYFNYIKKRLEEDSSLYLKALWSELRQMGYPGGYSMLSEALAYYGIRIGKKARKKELPQQSGSFFKPSNAAMLFLSPEKKFNKIQKELIHKLCKSSSGLECALLLARDFRNLMENKLGNQLRGWIERVQHSGISEITAFANGLLRDYQSIENAISLPWSNGPVEGNVNKLKTIKRQMYGRASFELLRKRLVLKPT